MTVGTAGSILLVIGGYWDGWWHFNIGRDTFWTRPHLLMYAHVIVSLGLALAGLRDWRFRPAAVITGLGSLISLAAAPLDNLWHALFGLDFTIWSLPHAAGIVYGGAASLIGIAVWWLVLEGSAETPPRAVAIRLGLAVQIGMVLLWLLFILMEYEYSLITRLAFPFRWDLQAVYYPVFIAYLTFAPVVAVALIVGPTVPTAGAVLAYGVLLLLAQWLRGVTPMAAPVPLFVPLGVAAGLTSRLPRPGGSLVAALAAVPMLYVALLLTGRPVPLALPAVAATAVAALAGALAGRLLRRALLSLISP